MSEEVKNFSRRYEARPDFIRASVPIVALTPAQVKALPDWPYLFRISVDPKKPYRKVWIWLFNDTSGAWQLDYDLVCTMNGEEVYRQKMVFASNAFTANQWLSNICIFQTNHMFVEGVTTYIQAKQLAIMPTVINITCDAMYMEVKTITGTLPHNGNLMVRSEAGI